MNEIPPNVRKLNVIINERGENVDTKMPFLEKLQFTIDRRFETDLNQDFKNASQTTDYCFDRTASHCLTIKVNLDAPSNRQIGVRAELKVEVFNKTIKSCGVDSSCMKNAKWVHEECVFSPPWCTRKWLDVFCYFSKNKQEPEQTLLAGTVATFG